METSDRMITCRTCGKDFVFTVREQEFFASRQFDEPRHCPECRAQRKRDKNLGQPFSPQTPPTRQTFSHEKEWSEVVCASCGKPTSVPFKPTSGRPVYCRECFSMQRSGDTARSQQAVTVRKDSQATASRPPVNNPKPPVKEELPVIPPHLLEEDMGPLPDIDPAPDEEGEITVAEFVPMGSFGGTPEEPDPVFEEKESPKPKTPQ